MRASTEGLDAPPTSEDGKIVEVDTTKENLGYRSGDTKACEQCEDPVPVDEPHIEAWVRVADTIGHQFYQPVFCEEECWAAWATGG